jgi:hypothetical protein
MAKESKYGEKTKMVNYRVPESKVAEINQIVKLKLNEYEKDALMLSERQFLETPIEFKANEMTGGSMIGRIQNGEVIEGDLISASDIKDVMDFKVKHKFTPNAQKNTVNMDALRAIANGEGVKSELFATKKKAISEIYDCIIVDRGVPQEADRVYYGSNNRIAFCDRYDNTVFYVNWEGKYYRFVNSSEFNKFLKDNKIK